MGLDGGDGWENGIEKCGVYVGSLTRNDAGSPSFSRLLPTLHVHVSSFSHLTLTRLALWNFLQNLSDKTTNLTSVDGDNNT